VLSIKRITKLPPKILTRILLVCLISFNFATSLQKRCLNFFFDV
jgi:hypothetical protein